MSNSVKRWNIRSWDVLARHHLRTAVGAITNLRTQPVSTVVDTVSNPTETTDFLFEIGTEEIPAELCPTSRLHQLREIATDSLTEPQNSIWRS